MKSISDLMTEAFTAKRYRTKIVAVKAVWKRNNNGQFIKKIRKSSLRHIKLKNEPMVTGSELIAENITANNLLLKKFKDAEFMRRKKNGAV